MIRSYKFRLYPTEDQEILLSKHFGCARYVYNWALNYKTEYYKINKKGISWMQLTKSNTFFDFKQENEWLKEVNSQSLISSIGNLDRAYTNFFQGRAKFPKFKKKNEKQSFQAPQHGKIDVKTGKLHIPKFKGGIKCIFHRPIAKGELGTFTISKNAAGKYFASILVHVEEEIKPKPAPKNAIGLDFGLKTFLTTSEGSMYHSPEFLKKNLKKLARLQRIQSRRTKGSSNRNKARIKVAKLHEKISNQRQNFLHKLSHKLVCKSQVDTICIEDLSLKGMQKLWGRKMSDLSWFEFTRQLQYKCDWYGKNLIKIGRFDPSSKMCSCCGKITQLKLSDRNWTCFNCNISHDRDINAAKNIKDFGMKYQLGQELSDVKSVEKKALAKNNRKKVLSETVFNEAEKKKVYVIRDLKPIDL
jgi:putative transposase